MTPPVVADSQDEAPSPTCTSKSKLQARFRSSLMKVYGFFTDNFGEEMSSWIKWKICDWAITLILIFLLRKAKNTARLSTVLEFMLEN